MAESLLVSIKADIFAKGRPELSTLLDGTIGELSPFHQTFGYYAETAVLSEGWEELQNENTSGVTGWCLSTLDIVDSKLAAGRPKDISYVREVLKHNLVDPEALRSAVEARTDQLGEEMRGRLARLSG